MESEAAHLKRTLSVINAHTASGSSPDSLSGHGHIAASGPGENARISLTPGSAVKVRIRTLYLLCILWIGSIFAFSLSLSLSLTHTHSHTHFFLFFHRFLLLSPSQVISPSSREANESVILNLRSELTMNM